MGWVTQTRWRLRTDSTWRRRLWAFANYAPPACMLAVAPMRIADGDVVGAVVAFSASFVTWAAGYRLRFVHDTGFYRGQESILQARREPGRPLPIPAPPHPADPYHPSRHEVI